MILTRSTWFATRIAHALRDTSPGLLTIALCSLVWTNCGAQQTQLEAALPGAPAIGAQSQTAPASSGNPLQGSVTLFEVLQKKSVVFPDLATTEGPLTSWEKFRLSANNSVSVSTVGAAVIGSALGQGIGSPDGWGQDWAGYGQRFGADLARESSANLFGTFLLASALHQDPRYYVKKNLSFGESVEYAAGRVMITRSDAGDQVVNYSGLVGPLLAEGLANAYYPDRNRTAASTFTRYASDLGWRFAGNMVRQYWPQLLRRIGATEQTELTTKP